jgi:hypothetical protein
MASMICRLNMMILVICMLNCQWQFRLFKWILNEKEIKLLPFISNDFLNYILIHLFDYIISRQLYLKDVIIVNFINYI